MLVSWNWLKEYVPLDVSVEDFASRLMMAGLNHESTTAVGNDWAVDLEVTSNRPDCLGHLGIAREAGVLFGKDLKLPKATPATGKTGVSDLTRVTLDSPKLCYRYTARVIRGVKVGPSPKWLQERLATIGIASINNVVDVTNYVLMECGQPLHAFDLAKLRGSEIIVRESVGGEAVIAIDHKIYQLDPGTCVIADKSSVVAIAGVMGGAETEVTPATKDLLIESAEFDPAAIRATARRLNLHSASSYRFERGLDPNGIDWASRRACELILELAGGELADGVIHVGYPVPKREPIVLRLPQIKRVLGIEVEPKRVGEILKALGCVAGVGAQGSGVGEQKSSLTPDPRALTPLSFVPPSWRGDLSREIDLIEEVARIHGYDKIPEDVSVPMATSARSEMDLVLERVRHTLTALGYDEAMTVSVVEEEWSEAFSPWTSTPPLVSQIPLLRRNNCLRRSLVPSLLGARRTNESLANPVIELFEIARVYLPQPKGLPVEELMLGLTHGGSFLEAKGAIEAVVAELNPRAELEVRDVTLDLLVPGRACELWLDGKHFGYLGEVSPEGLKRFDLRGGTAIAEVKVGGLLGVANLVPRYVELSAYPATSRDINLEVADAVRWADVAATVRQAGGPLLEQLEFREEYRDKGLKEAGRKSLLMALTLRSQQGTLTNQEADGIRDAVVKACETAHGARLRV